MLRVAVAHAASLQAGFATPVSDLPPGWLGEAELARWRESAPPARRDLVASRWLARQLLQAATGHAATRWQLSAARGSAPVASRSGDADSTADGDGTDAPVVSLSHRLGWVAAAVASAAEGDVGVDVECLRPSRSAAAERAALMLPASEHARWCELAVDEREPALLRGWVAREAWFKAMPTGRAPWDFTRIGMRRCDAAEANVRTWESGTVFLAVCCGDPAALAAASCDGFEAAGLERSSSWVVARGD